MAKTRKPRRGGGVARALSRRGSGRRQAVEYAVENRGKIPLERPRQTRSKIEMSQPEQSSPRWFREPNRREHWIAAGLFGGFGVFFVMLFIVQGGWWFRWVMLVLGVFSVMRGLRHLINVARSKE
jgi:hypothetical protein